MAEALAAAAAYIVPFPGKSTVQKRKYARVIRARAKVPKPESNEATALCRLLGKAYAVFKGFYRTRRHIPKITDRGADNIKLCFQNSSRDVFSGSFLIGSCLLLFSANDVLNCLRQLRDVTALDIFADLSCAFQIIKIGIPVRQTQNRFVVQLRTHQQHLIARIIQICCYCENAQTHRAGQLTNGCFIDDLVVGEIIFSILEFLVDKQRTLVYSIIR